MGVVGSPWLFLRMTVEGLGESGGLRDFRASIHSQLSPSDSGLSQSSFAGFRRRTTPTPFCCGCSAAPGWPLGARSPGSDWSVPVVPVVLDVRGLRRMVSEEPAVTMVTAGSDPLASLVFCGAGLLRSVAVPSLAWQVVAATVDRGRGSGRGWHGCWGNGSTRSPGPGRPSMGPLMVRRRLMTSSPSDPRPPAPGWRRRMAGLTCR